MKFTLAPLFRNDMAIGLALSLFAFCVYLMTVSPSMGWEDSGEIAAAIHSLGIVHPTGYPLFTLIGKVFLDLPLGDLRVIMQLNLMVAIFTAASVYFFYRLFLFLLSREGRELFGSVPAKAPENLLPARLAAGSAALVFAFSRTFWSEATTLEVYSLHLVFMSLVSLLFLRAVSGLVNGRDPRGTGRLWMAFAYALGLSFSNHMMTVLLAPAFLWLFFSKLGLGRFAWANILRAAPPFVAGLSVYLYLPIRAASSPIMNWGDPSTLGAFWRHVNAHQYRSFMFSSWEVPQRKLAETFAIMPVEFGFAPLLAAMAGLWFLWRRNQGNKGGRGSRGLLVFSLLLLVTGLVYETNYNFADPNFRLPLWFVLVLWVAVGLKGLLDAPVGTVRRAGFAVALALPLFPLTLNYAAENRRGDYAAEDFARNMLASVERGGLLYSREYKSFMGPALYLQLVEKVRPDVVILGLGAIPSYLDQLERRYPWILEGLQREREAYVREYERLDHGNRETEYVYKLFGELLLLMLWKGYPERPVYVTQATELEPNVIPVPEGLAYRLYKEPHPPVSPVRKLFIRPIHRKGDAITKELIREYAQAYANQGIYRAVALGDTALGRHFMREALKVDPGYAPARQWLHRLRQGGN